MKRRGWGTGGRWRSGRGSADLLADLLAGQGRGRRFLAVGGIFLASISAAAGEANTTGWRPVLSSGFVFHLQTIDASGDSTLNFAGDDSTNVLTSLLGVDLALYTPAIVEGWGSPRLFAHAGGQFPLSDSFTILRSLQSFGGEGIGGAVRPETRAACLLVAGDGKFGCDQSLEMTLTLDGVWNLGIGAEFTLPFREREYRLRPSLDYLGQLIGAEGVASKDDRGEGVSSGVLGGVVETFSIGASTEETLHSVGPRLALDVVVARMGPVSINVFAETMIYWLIDREEIRFSGSSQHGSAEFRFEPDPFLFQAGAGLRLVWTGNTPR